jgi:hypothetical protein
MDQCFAEHFHHGRLVQPSSAKLFWSRVEENTMSPDPVNSRQQEDTFRCAPMVRFPLGGSHELVYFPLQQVVRVLSARDIRLIGSCSQFADLAAHTSKLLEGPVDRDADVLQRLTAFAEAGLLLSREELTAHIGTFLYPGVPAKLSWLAIPTLDRPEQLLRAIESYALHFSRYGRSLKLLVADDSRSIEQSRALKESLRSRFAGSGQALYYLGPEEKRQFLALLTRDGAFPHDVVEFGLFGPSGHAPTMGANRNAILLQTAGEMVLSADDDTICQPRIPPDADGADFLRLGSHGDPNAIWFFPDRPSALAYTRPTEIDIAGAHERLLGKSVWSLVAPNAGNGVVDLSHACDHLLQSIWSGKGAIPITLNGFVGDSGLYSERNLLALRDPATRLRLVNSEETLQTALRSREVLRQARFATVCHGGPFVTMFTGIDNRGLLPPFFPAYRGEDRVFGHTLNQCMGSCYFGYLPWALVHAPSSGRSSHPDGVATVRISDLVCACISTWICTNHWLPVADHMRALGRHLIEMGSAEPDGFREGLRMLMLKQASRRTTHEEGLLRQYGKQPEYWAAELRKNIETRLMAAVKSDYMVPVDLPQHLPKEELLGQAQDLIRRYGELLLWWPAIVEQAKALAATKQLPAARIE